MRLTLVQKSTIRSAANNGARYISRFLRLGTLSALQLNAIVAFVALAITGGAALAQSSVTIAVGGSSCLCYLPPVLANQLGEFSKAGVNVNIVNFNGGQTRLRR
jgi:ABC-type nitrate/sulfonate/bicarbonate transport system substrate-binding protein